MDRSRYAQRTEVMVLSRLGRRLVACPRSSWSLHRDVFGSNLHHANLPDLALLGPKRNFESSHEQHPPLLICAEILALSTTTEESREKDQESLTIRVTPPTSRLLPLTFRTESSSLRLMPIHCYLLLEGIVSIGYLMGRDERSPKATSDASPKAWLPRLQPGRLFSSPAAAPCSSDRRLLSDSTYGTMLGYCL
jgi:hypothetical protein